MAEIQLKIIVPRSDDPEIQCMDCLTQVMRHFTSVDLVVSDGNDFDANARISKWFSSKFGGDENGRK